MPFYSQNIRIKRFRNGLHLPRMLRHLRIVATHGTYCLSIQGCSTSYSGVFILCTIAHTLLCNPPACHTVGTGELCSIDHAAAAIETQERLVQAFSYAQAIQRRRCRFCLQHLYQLCCVCGKMLLAADQEVTHLQLHCCFGDMQELQLILVLHTANVSLVLQAW